MKVNFFLSSQHGNLENLERPSTKTWRKTLLHWPKQDKAGDRRSSSFKSSVGGS